MYIGTNQRAGIRVKAATGCLTQQADAQGLDPGPARRLCRLADEPAKERLQLRKDQVRRVLDRI